MGMSSWKRIFDLGPRGRGIPQNVRPSLMTGWKMKNGRDMLITSKSDEKWQSYADHKQLLIIDIHMHRDNRKHYDYNNTIILSITIILSRGKNCLFLCNCIGKTGIAWSCTWHFSAWGYANLKMSCPMPMLKTYITDGCKLRTSDFWLKTESGKNI